MKKKLENYELKKLYRKSKPYIKMDEKITNLIILKLKNANFINTKALFE